MCATAPRSCSSTWRPGRLWQVAEQLLGQGTVVWPAGLDASGGATGPAFMCDDAVGGLVSHVGHAMGYPPEGTFRTEPALRLPASGPVWLNGQGTRGLYCTLPGSPPQAPGYPGAHSDGACYGRFRLQVSAYIDDLPPGCGGFTVWPGSHARIWTEQWEAFRGGEKHTDKSRAVRRAGGYSDPVITRIKDDTEPVDCHGPAGTVVLWHTKILHMAGLNTLRGRHPPGDDLRVPQDAGRRARPAGGGRHGRRHLAGLVGRGGRRRLAGGPHSAAAGSTPGSRAYRTQPNSGSISRAFSKAALAWPRSSRSRWARPIQA